MSLKAIEMQIALPRTQDAGKIQEQLQQRSQVQLDHAAHEVQKQVEKNEHSVVKEERKHPYSLMNRKVILIRDLFQSRRIKRKKKRKKPLLLVNSIPIKDNRLTILVKRDFMSGIFMFILFLLNMLTIFAVIVLFLRQSRFIQAEKEQKAIIAEIEELMSGYMMEMKEENETLVEKLVSKKQPLVKQDKEKEGTTSKETITSFKETANLDDQNIPVISKVTTMDKAVDAYKKQSQSKHNMIEESGLLNEDRLGLSVESEKKVTNPEKSSFMEALQASLSGQSSHELSLHEQAYSLAKQGLSAEEIAQTLKLGKTEVELLLKFQTDK